MSNGQQVHRRRLLGQPWERGRVTPVGNSSGRMKRASTSLASIDITMAQLLVRGIEVDLVTRLKVRAARKGHSAEEEHRQILRAALFGESRISLADALAGMPEVGEDEDFERPADLGREPAL
jgi:plasmid stability protein